MATPTRWTSGARGGWWEARANGPQAGARGTDPALEGLGPYQRGAAGRKAERRTHGALSGRLARTWTSRIGGRNATARDTSDALRGSRAGRGPGLESGTYRRDACPAVAHAIGFTVRATARQRDGGSGGNRATATDARSRHGVGSQPVRSIASGLGRRQGADAVGKARLPVVHDAARRSPDWRCARLPEPGSWAVTPPQAHP